MKPSAQIVLDYLRLYGASTTTDLLRKLRTTCIHKRLSELRKAGLVMKAPSPHLKGRMEYWAVSR